MTDVTDVSGKQTPRTHEIVVYGATGFVGRLVAERLARHGPPDLRVALAGRSRKRLARLRDGLGHAAAGWPLIVADATDRTALDRMAADTHVVATTVGPYAAYGREVVAACVEAGTHYADLTAELLFIRDVIAAHHERAQETGARIVHACGFDSIPSDLGVWVLHRWAAEAGAGGLTNVVTVVRSMYGGISGGTVDSLRRQVDEIRGDPSLRRVLADPSSLNPPGEPAPESPDSGGVRRDPQLGTWTAPFVMAPFNTRIVRRSNGLLGGAYGPLHYREVVATGTGPLAPVAAAGLTAGTRGLALALAVPGLRSVTDRILPSPGEGPSERTRERGHFALDVHGRTESGRDATVRVAADADPGYGATSLMLAEAAQCLARDGDRLPDRAGVLTPATAMGDPLVERLRAAGMTLEVSHVT